MSALVEFYASMHPGAVSLTLGVPRTGKTTGMIAAMQAGAIGPRVLVADPYARVDRAEMRRGEPVTPWPGMLITPEDLAANAHVLDQARGTIVVCPRGTLSEYQLGLVYGRVLELVWHTGRYDIVAEEFGLWGRAAYEWANRIATGGGHPRLRLHALCQSLGRVQRDVRRVPTHIVSYAQGDSEDITELRKRCGRPFAEAVARLRPRDGERPADPPLTWRLGATLTQESTL